MKVKEASLFQESLHDDMLNDTFNHNFRRILKFFSSFECLTVLFCNLSVRAQHTEYPSLCLERSMIITAATSLYAILGILAGFLHYASKDQMLHPCKHCRLISECQPQLCKCLTKTCFTGAS